jgi:mono/diheme cytochrome c family protein
MAVLAAMVCAAAPGRVHAQAAGQWKDPTHVYAKICSNCHDSGVAPRLKGRKLEVPYIQVTVRHGLKAMPAFRVTDVDVPMLAQLADFLSTSTRAAK